MSQPLSVLERNNPPPRRKSCRECVKAKRRCSLDLPVCQRCAQRGFTCEYPEGSRRTTPSWPGSLADPTDRGSLEPAEPSTSTTCPPGPSTDPALSSGPSFDFDVPDAVWGESGAARAGPPRPHLAAAPNLHQTTLAFLPPNLAHETLIRTHLQYSMDKLFDVPYQMVLENQTPWCHPSLYDQEMPKSIRDAQSSCALWMARNQANSEVIFRSIESRVQEIVSSPLPTEPLESLARLQALLLYQLIRIYNSDARANSSALETRKGVEDAAFALLGHVVFEDAPPRAGAGAAVDPSAFFPNWGLQDLSQFAAGPSSHHQQTYYQQQPQHQQQHQQQQSSDYPSVLPPPDQHPANDVARNSFWRSWVFQESARRTLTTVLLFNGAPGQHDNCLGEVRPGGTGGLAGLDHSFTLSADLWRARDPAGFEVAWRTGRRFVVRNEDFTDALSHARPDDFDAFSKIIMSVALGIAQARALLQLCGSDL